MKKLLVVQTVVLLFGAVFAWQSVTKNFIRFYHIEGTIFKVTNCSIPNPITEACFYGAVAFVVAFLLSLVIIRTQEHRYLARQKYLLWFLCAGTVFAWFNVSKEFIAFYSAHGKVVLGGSATPITSPFYTPCFTGAMIFLLSAFVAYILFVYGRKGVLK